MGAAHQGAGGLQRVLPRSRGKGYALAAGGPRQASRLQETDFRHSGGGSKGFQETLLIRLGKLLQESRKPLSAADAGRMLGISRSSARRYLELLVQREEVAVDFELTTVGRPQKLYFATGPVVKREQNSAS